MKFSLIRSFKGSSGRWIMGLAELEDIGERWEVATE
jgi:hypothetical protein